MKKLTKLVIYVLICCSSLSLEAQERTNSLNGEVNGHQYVDMGLPSGTLWAATNIGALEVYDCGDFFAWGEITTKNSFFDYNYLYKMGLPANKKSYNSEDIQIEARFDVASLLWGSEWKMPSRHQFEELLICKHYTTEKNGVQGMLFEASNGNTLFFPYYGGKYKKEHKKVGETGYFWTREKRFVRGLFRAYYYALHTDPINEENLSESYYGMNVRPVLSKRKYLLQHSDDENEYPSLLSNQETVDLALPSGTLWATTNLGADKPSEMGGLYVWGGVMDVSDCLTYKVPYRYEDENAYDENNNVYYDKYVSSKWFGKKDFKSKLSAEDDAATSILGNEWCTPTPEQWIELCKECNVCRYSFQGVDGLLFKGKNDSVLFLPNAPCKEYSKELGINHREAYYYTTFFYHTNTVSTNNNKTYVTEFSPSGLNYFRPDPANGYNDLVNISNLNSSNSPAARITKRTRGDAYCVRPVKRVEKEVENISANEFSVTTYLKRLHVSSGSKGDYKDENYYTLIIESNQRIVKFEILNNANQITKTKSYKKGRCRIKCKYKPESFHKLIVYSKDGGTKTLDIRVIRFSHL